MIVLYFILLACTQSSIQDSAEEQEEILFVSPDQEGPYDAGLHSFSFVSDSAWLGSLFLVW